jgi:hypothetical protein
MLLIHDDLVPKRLEARPTSKESLPPSSEIDTSPARAPLPSSADTLAPLDAVAVVTRAATLSQRVGALPHRVPTLVCSPFQPMPVFSTLPGAARSNRRDCGSG